MGTKPGLIGNERKRAFGKNTLESFCCLESKTARSASNEPEYTGNSMGRGRTGRVTKVEQLASTHPADRHIVRRTPMINTRSFVISIILAMLSTPLIHAQDLSSYRGFQLGMSLAAASKQAKINPSEAKVIYQRPAVIQELEWRPGSFSDSSAKADPVQEILFGFYDDKLYRIVVSYDRDRTEGLTDEDLIESISAKYGTPITPVAKIISSSASQSYGDSQNVIARWEDSQYSFNLFRFSYESVPGMLVLSMRLDALAQVAIVEAIRLNKQEEPQREIDRQKQQDDQKRAAGRKARPANKASFRP
jgi:hypothetical protein